MIATAPQVAGRSEGFAAPRDDARLVSLDAFRGFTMFWIVGGSALMTGLRALGPNPVLDTIAHHLDHSDWQGLRYYDLIWPSFMLMVGASVPFSHAKRSLTETQFQMHLHAVRRAAILFLLGSLRASISSGTPAWIELSSALQPIAVAYLVAHFLAFASWKAQAAVGGAIFLGYALLLELVSAPGIPAGSYDRNLNIVKAVDLAVLGRAHSDGWGTVLSTIPTISTTLAGLLIGQLLRSALPQRKKIAVLGLAGLGGVALGWAMNPWVPVIMKLWTTSYGIAATGWACLLFLAFYWVIDVRGWRKWAFPLAVIGVNALAIYMSRTIIPLSRMAGIFTRAVQAELGTFEPLCHAVLVLVVEWLVLYWMYRRRIFLRP